ncbi:hypothetical protein Ga0074812_107290 [Parafrankia irregularis]|uniref:Uncharacterized protein n=1 Tax=Parafrankia irregularis TaxID=795642 RepID=A0A0S4QPG1_9ACTN|nr:hypothetical protein Ga0074812_107290 [Parafrankia irregularis]
MDSPVVVAGVVNVQQTIPVEGFPVAYTPVRYLPHGLRLETSGVGLKRPPTAPSSRITRYGSLPEAGTRRTGRR